MPKESVFTCDETEDLSGICSICGKGIECHGSDYECLTVKQ